VDKGQTGHHQKVAEIQGVPTVGEDTFLDEGVGVHLPVLSASGDIGKSDDERAQDLPGHCDSNANDIEDEVESPVAFPHDRLHGERKRQKDDREDEIAGPKEKVPQLNQHPTTRPGPPTRHKQTVVSRVGIL
jgi:hypothetical protein